MNDLYKLIEKFILEYLPTEKGCSKNTALSYYSTIKQYLEFHGCHISRNDIGILDFNRDNIGKFLEHMESKGCTVSTRNQKLMALRSFVSYCALIEPIYQNTYSELAKFPLKKEGKKKMDFLTITEYETFLKCIDISTSTGFRHFTIINVLYETGARAQELADLKVEDIDFGKINSIRLMGKGNKFRIVYICDRCADIIRKYQEKFDRYSGPLFINGQGKPLTRFGLEYIVEKYFKLAKEAEPSLAVKRITPHSLRHTKACHFLDAGTPLPIIQRFLGHASIQTTEIYLDVTSTAVVNAVEHASKQLSPHMDEEQTKRWKDKSMMEKIKAAFA